MCEPSKFHAIPEIAYKGEPSGPLSSIPPKVLVVHNVRCCYMCRIGELGDLEIKESFGKLCDSGILKEEFEIIE